MMKRAIALGSILLTASTALGNPPAATSTTGPTPDEALQQLVDGNIRFQADSTEHPHADQGRRCDTVADGQHPIASVLACADSRVPVELVFDQGIGDLFVIRVAGNVSDTDEIGTIEYGAGHLGTPLIVVLGHTKCGAVTAVVEGAHVGPNIAKLVDNIVPAADATRAKYPKLTGAALVTQSIRANVWQSIEDLLGNSEEVRELVKSGKVKVVGAVYDLHSGTVEWLGQHPEQSRLLQLTGGTNETVSHDAPKTSHDAQDAHATPAAKETAHKEASHGDEHADHKEEASHTDEKHAEQHGDAHGEAKGESHEEGHTDAHGEAHPPAGAESKPATARMSSSNEFLILGGLLACASAVSTFLFRFIKRTKPVPVPVKSDGH